MVSLSMGLVIAALLAHSVSAQGPGGGRGGRGGGPPGGGFGGFGGPRSQSLISLATRTPVQEELKLTEKQKTDVKALSDKIDTRRREQFSRNRGPNGGPGGGPNGGGFGPGGRGFGGARGKGEAPKDDAKDKAEADTKSTKGKTAGTGSSKSKSTAKGKGTTAKGKAGAPGAPGGPGADFRAAFAKQQADDEAELSKILNTTQRQRLVQIQLQQEGPMAVTKPDVQKKLGMTKTQVSQVAAILDESSQARGEARRQMFDLFRTPDGGFNQEAMKAKMQDPAFKRQMDNVRKESDAQNEMIQNQTIQQITAVLTTKQKQAFNKMLGTPFDLSKLERDRGGDRGNGNGRNRGDASKKDDTGEQPKGGNTKGGNTKGGRRGN